MRWLGILESKPGPHSRRERGFMIAYRSGEVNHCPGCGRSQWHVGRSTAECAFCATAIPLAASGGDRR